MVSKGNVKGIIHKEGYLPITTQLEPGKSLTVTAGDFLEIAPLSDAVLFVTLVALPNKRYTPEDLEFQEIQSDPA